MTPRLFPVPAPLPRAVFAALLCFALLTGCTGTGYGPLFAAPEARVSAAQACAIGYDMSRQIYEQVSLRRTVLLAPRRATPCERHALEYLRRAGFRIATPEQGGTGFDIRLTRLDAETVSAIAEIGDGLRIARLYHPVATGVRASGPPSIQHLAPDTYTPREARR